MSESEHQNGSYHEYFAHRKVPVENSSFLYFDHDGSENVGSEKDDESVTGVIHSDIGSMTKLITSLLLSAFGREKENESQKVNPYCDEEHDIVGEPKVLFV